MHGPREISNKLTTNHRQQQGSLVAHACLSVLDGNMPIFGTRGENTIGGILNDDLFFIEKDDKEEIPDTVANLCRTWHENHQDYAILAPQKTGVCGVDAINKHLQETLNPEHQGKPQIKLGWLTLRQGDKVLPTKNNYDLGVFNGFTGTIMAITDDVITVDFDGEFVVYEEAEHIKQLTLGYCMTIHKSQGSQFNYGILICHSSHYYMWSRSILYTGISRFRQQLHVVGDKRAIKRGLSNVVSGERNTILKLKLTEVA
jgi:exodeoxyribonuclease V alpha subunit